MGKRGQVSTFIIIGLLVLVIIGVFFFFKEYIIEPYVPPALAPLVVYTESCIKTIGEEALTLASTQGGYVYLPEKITKTSDSYINLAFRVPQWYYQGENRIPSQKNIETQLAHYLNQNLNACLKNFDAFKDRFSFNANVSVTSSVSIEDTTVVVQVEIPLTVTALQENITIAFPNTAVHIDHALGKMYSLGKAIMEHENSAAFLENFTDEMIAVSDYLPYEGMELTCEPKRWTITQISDYLKNQFMYNLKYIMFENTNYRETEYPYYNKQYKVSVTKNDFSDLSVNTLYSPQWPLEVDVLPNDNGVVKPLHMDIPEVIGQCIKIYHHKYSLNYPVLFQIINTEKPEQQFYFATPVLLRRNEPNRYNEIPLWADEIDVTASKEYCSNASEVTVYTQDTAGTIITQPGVSSNLQYNAHIFAFDDALPEPSNSLAGVNISFHCVKFRCAIGETAYHRGPEGMYTGGLAELSTQFPPCQHGMLIAEKEGYLSVRKPITTSAETDGQQVTLKMTRLKPFNIHVTVIQDHNNILTERELQPDEQVIMTLKQPQQRQEYWRIFPPQPDTPTEPIELLVGPFMYTLDFKVMKHEQVYGGLMLNWTPDLSELGRSNTIEFFVYVKDPLLPPTTPQEFMLLWNYAVDNSYKYPPRFR